MASSVCSIENCDGTVVGRTLCRKHYLRWWKHGDPLIVLQEKNLPHCAAPDCNKARLYGHRFCRMHKARWDRHKSLEAPNQARGTFEERFWNKVLKAGSIPGHIPDIGPCWTWKGKPGAHGYGQIKGPNEQITTSHVASWIIHFGPVPKDMCVCHRCDNRLCPRPDHLFLGTIADNNRDMHFKGRHWAQAIRQEALAYQEDLGAPAGPEIQLFREDNTLRLPKGR